MVASAMKSEQHILNLSMSKDSGSIFRLLLVVVSAFFMSHAISSAQPKSLGATFSFSGFSISYEHRLKDNG